MMNPKSQVAVIPFPFTSHLLPLVNLVYDIAATITWEEETTKELKSQMVEALEPFLEVAVASFEDAINAAVKENGVRVSCLLIDGLMAFSCKIAEKLQAKWVAVWVPTPSILPAYIYRDLIVPLLKEMEGEASCVDISQKIKDLVPGFSTIHFADLTNRLRTLDPAPSTYFRMLRDEVGHLLPCADAIVMNSYEELSPAPLTSALRSSFRLLLHVGCLTVRIPPSLPASSRLDQTGCLELLDKQKPRSAVYISFGTLTSLTPEEMSTLSEALEENRTPYIWSIKDHLKVHLPLGFVERTSSYGKVVPWAPQSQVLSHPSIGAHITHCGYNAVFESIVGEVPMICKPMWADNMINARMVEDAWGIGVRVVGPIITKDEMLTCLKMVLGDEERGKELKAKIKAVKEVLMEAVGPNGSTSKDFKSLVELISTE
ncbi:anthocyanidin 3-O-glucosyltransferase 7-like isoform X1 [Punica granatum]|uniref:Glycosyltransferase n=4 Tax=Punica granatum TaxID=22663 RepID=A0A6P8CDF0_PUNGR|nr:anthocyanidin 3-O-glucosyltransferase 7-like isoform X1 [Punica granatum]XP_031379018.1 anthocyanidin 3-O-glucosyltransferase 7-like isoform X1 [Punica granatum]XP_031379019.1 anthocyanidin 3-O-glucosyltransferase 7-like isoform X1 [Punica granatum]